MSSLHCCTGEELCGCFSSSERNQYVVEAPSVASAVVVRFELPVCPGGLGCATGLCLLDIGNRWPMPASAAASPPPEGGSAEASVASSMTRVVVSRTHRPPPGFDSQLLTRPLARPCSKYHEDEVVIQLTKQSADADRVCPLQSSLQNTTLNGVLAVSSSIVDITPHLAGAIDVIAVRQPDGSLKCTPFFGAHWFTQLRSPVKPWLLTCSATTSNGDALKFVA